MKIAERVALNQEAITAKFIKKIKSEAEYYENKLHGIIEV